MSHFPLPSQRSVLNAPADVTSFLHRHGVNLRYIGLVAKSIEEQFIEGNLADAPPSKFKAIRDLTIEAVSRVIKFEMKEKLRRQMKQIRVPLEVRLGDSILTLFSFSFLTLYFSFHSFSLSSRSAFHFPSLPLSFSPVKPISLSLSPSQVPYRRIVVDYLNLIFSRRDESAEWWRAKLPSLLVALFKFSTESVEAILQKSDLSFDRSEGRHILVHRMIELTGAGPLCALSLSLSLSFN